MEVTLLVKKNLVERLNDNQEREGSNGPKLAHRDLG